MSKVKLKQDEKGNILVPGKCSCCKKCLKYASGPLKGYCIYGGPFEGYVQQIEEETPGSPNQEGSLPKV